MMHFFYVETDGTDGRMMNWLKRPKHTLTKAIRSKTGILGLMAIMQVITAHGVSPLKAFN